jgi:hypothetical protein
MKHSLAAFSILTVTILSLGASCNPLNKPPEAPAPTPTASAGDTLNQSKQQYTDSLGRAKGWQANATLARVYRVYEGRIDTEAPPSLLFSYASLAEPGRSFEVKFDKDDVGDRKVPKQPFELNLTPIDAGEWQVDPDRAFQLAEESGGKAFREQHLAGYKVLQQLAKNGQYPLQWLVRYDTGDGSKMRYEIYINASSGIVESKKEQNI